LPSADAALRQSLALGRVEGQGASLAEVILQPALNVRGIRAGAVGEQAANAIPTAAYASFDFRLVPNQTPARVRALVTAHLEQQGYFVTEDSVTPALRLAHPRIARTQWADGGYPAGRTPLDLPIARSVTAAIAAGLGQAPLLVPTLGGSGPHYLFQQLLHTPVLVLPIANYDDNQHGADENLRLQNLRDGVAVYVGVFAGTK
jgi:acetylornithine deacetylase/succinyl-diaminopimelate desuccinylase-like protein